MTNNGGIYGSFGLVWKTFVFVVILLVATFGLGYCKGYQAGKSASPTRNIQNENSYPNVIKDADGNLRPADGFRWINPDDPKDFRVERKP
jgi:hypothetical protein